DGPGAGRRLPQPTTQTTNRADASVNGKAAEHSTATSADVDAKASFGAGNTGPTVGGVDGRVNAQVNDTGAAARADLDANLGTHGIGTASGSGNGQLVTSTNNDGAII